MGEKEFYRSIDNEYRTFYFMHGSLRCETIAELFVDHLEGDTRVIFHEKHVKPKFPGNTIFQGNGTDIFIILLENVKKLS